LAENLRLLLVEDSEDDAILLARALRGNGYTVSFERVDTRPAMEDALQNECWDAVISDYNLPTFSMSAALETLHESGLDIPFIIVSGTIGDHIAVEAMKAGAHDYIMKDNLARLAPAIEREIREAERRRQRQQVQKELQRSEQENERLYEQYAILAEIGRIISSSLKIEDVFENFAAAVRKLIPFDKIGISLVHTEPDTLILAYTVGVEVPGRRVGDIFTIPGTIAERVILTRAASIANLAKPAKGPEEFPQLEETWKTGLKCALAAPLISNDEIIGTLQFRSFEGNVYNERHITLAENIATQISGAIANARLYAEQQQLKEQLLHSQKMEAVGRLAGGIAHDFNNLLTPILSYAQMGMMRLPEDNKVRGNLQEIYKAGERAADLVSKLLAFSKRNFIEPRIINLNDLVLNIGSITQRLIGEDVHMATSLDPELDCVKIDPGQMEQVLMNLIVNSRDAMPDGGTISITTSRRSLSDSQLREHPDVSPGDYVMLSVSDTGMGMSEEVRSHIFEPFYTTKTQGKGTGLGLSTCYGIIKQGQGHIEVASRINEGTIICVYLPVAADEAESEQPSEYTDSWPTGSETILLVEDDPSVCDMASLLLRDQGYNVIQASNGVEGLQLAKQYGGTEIHLLLTDVMMPKMGGWELSQKLKLYHPETRVIYTSGYTDDEALNQGAQNKTIECLYKPYTPEKLARKIRAVLDGSPQKAPAHREIPMQGLTHAPDPAG
jgi:signal transduction histidine kinase/DNA-binding response OmpR family regulator